MSKIIIEDTTKYEYKFKKIQFRDLTNGQMFVDKNGNLFIKTAYCDLIDKYATSLLTGDYILIMPYEEVHPVDCEISFSKILQHVEEVKK